MGHSKSNAIIILCLNTILKFELSYFYTYINSKCPLGHSSTASHMIDFLLPRNKITGKRYLAMSLKTVAMVTGKPNKTYSL